MGKHLNESGQSPKPAHRYSLRNPFRSSGEGQSNTPVLNKIAAGVVAVGAFAAVGQPLTANAASEQHAVQPQAVQQDAGKAPASVQFLGAQPAQGSQPQVQQLAKSQAVQAKSAPAPQAKSGSDWVKPTEGRISSGYGTRSGGEHKGVDIANKLGTPIHSVGAGKVVSAGKASGFGQWVRVQHADNSISVYGHVNTIDVHNGQQVQPGQQIATLGNKGKSTGPHLHFGVDKGGQKINPMPWLAQHGISL